ncbi:heavy metal-associated isoprenylated plant protein 43-like [Cynara cardunculus var. scolymus]|uniref:Heavy metal-associated domain, HMA n=1 Tax=Cynara cardunculus var. scolymus TaxID=59895 RepID=A0A124SH88_CYNCS|nr:heavy metal-associated isoprenylated plant protein 43-like [Cynara cardunculus var. scolymus]KVI08806.1 Heavy metal-associated domain, HMA [Cynara cardunculus var. scolymus]
MVQKTVLKVQLSCEKCKKKILRSVSGLQGVDKIEIDGAKGTVTVTGDADPYEIILQTKKAGKFVEVVTIGPPPAPPKKPEEKKPEEKKQTEKKPEEKVHMHPYDNHMRYDCIICQQMGMGCMMTIYEQPNPACTIM